MLWSLRPKPVPVDLGTAQRGELRKVVSGEGKTRVRDVWTVAAPVTGHLERIELDPGDTVESGQTVAKIFPTTPSPLDARTRDELQAHKGAAQAALAQARQTVEQIEAEVDLAENEARRFRKLVEAQSATTRQLDIAETELRAKHSQLRSARLAVVQAQRQLEALASQLEAFREPVNDTDAPVLHVHAPVGATVLRVYRRSSGPVVSGAGLLDLGDPGQLELVVDLPTRSAVQVSAGAPVTIDAVGNETRYSGRVRIVEPAAFTKVTALGVEEQRVNVIIEPAGAHADWSPMQDGFAADAHVQVFREQSVLSVPTAAVFRHGDSRAVFVVEENEARLQIIETGVRGGNEVQILKGLKAGDPVVLYPSDKVSDRVRVVYRADEY